MDDHGRGSGFHIAVVDGRGRGDNSVQMRERVVVTGEIDRFTICRMCDNGVCSELPITYNREQTPVSTKLLPRCLVRSFAPSFAYAYAAALAFNA